MNDDEELHGAEKDKDVKHEKFVIPKGYTLGRSSKDSGKEPGVGTLILSWLLIVLGVLGIAWDLQDRTPDFLGLLLSVGVLVCGILGVVQWHIRKKR